MLPINLELENFYCHSKSEIDFTQFTSAVIVGKINGNDKFSNGAGKSTIFAAIRYVLFNEVDTSSLDKVIKHDATYCKVTFIFQSFLDGHIYKVVRYRGKKPGTDVRLYRKLGELWEDLTQRKTTDTEKELFKLLKINYKTFSNSVLFAQGDLSGLAAMTPRERKIALKEALQLSIYSKYEATTKKKLSDLVKELEKTQTLISVLGGPQKEIESLSKEYNTINSQKIEYQNLLLINNTSISKLKTELLENQNKINIILSNHNEKQTELENKIKEIKLIKAENEKLTTKLSEYLVQQKSISNNIDQYQNKINQLSLDFGKESEIEINQLLNECKNKLAEYQAEFKSSSSKLDELLVPMPKDAICNHCRQSISKEARIICQTAIDKEIGEVKIKLKEIKQAGLLLVNEEKQLQNKLQKIKNRNSTIQEYNSNIIIESNKLKNLNDLINEFSNLKVQKEQDLKNKIILLDNIKLQIVDLSTNSEFNQLQDLIKNIKFRLNNEEQNNTIYNNKLNSLSNQEAVLNHQIEKRNEDLNKLNTLKTDLSNLEYNHLLYQKVLTAFGPNGIPALITHTILDDFQIEANNFLAKLRPGLQLQFLIEKDRENGELADTLDIIYLLNNAQLEFTQLSGAQKLIVSLSLKLGLAAIINKRLGIDIKMLLIDEADQSLDEASLEAFEQAIKFLQQDYKILVITHNNELKTKFSSVIVVEQDQFLNSTIKLLQGWQ